MSVFTALEIEYLASQKLGRLATLGADGAPHVVPVSFRYDPDRDVVEIGGHGFGRSKKFRDVQRDGRVAFVVDDVLPPWQPRGVEIRGTAEAVSGGGTAVNPAFDDALVRITPTRVIGWGLDTDAFAPNARSVGAAQ